MTDFANWMNTSVVDKSFVKEPGDKVLVLQYRPQGLDISALNGP